MKDRINWVTRWIIIHLYPTLRVFGVIHFGHDREKGHMVPSSVAKVYGIAIGFFFIATTPIVVLKFFSFAKFPVLKKTINVADLTDLYEMMAYVMTIITIYLWFGLKANQWRIAVNQAISLRDCFDRPPFKNKVFNSDHKLLFHFFTTIVANFMPMLAIFVLFNILGVDSSGIVFVGKLLQLGHLALSILSKMLVSIAYISGTLYAAHLYRLVNSEVKHLMEDFNQNSIIITQSQCQSAVKQLGKLISLHDRVTLFVQDWHKLFSCYILVNFLGRVTTIVCEVNYSFLIEQIVHIIFDCDHFSIFSVSIFIYY